MIPLPKSDDSTPVDLSDLHEKYVGLADERATANDLLGTFAARAFCQVYWDLVRLSPSEIRGLLAGPPDFIYRKELKNERRETHLTKLSRLAAGEKTLASRIAKAIRYALKYDAHPEDLLMVNAGSFYRLISEINEEERKLRSADLKGPPPRLSTALSDALRRPGDYQLSTYLENGRLRHEVRALRLVSSRSDSVS